MFTQKLCIAFLTLALSSFAAQAAPQFHKFPGRDIHLGRAAKAFTVTARQNQRNGGFSGGGGGGGDTGGNTNGRNGGNNSDSNSGGGTNNTQDGNNNQGGNQGGGGDAQTTLTLDPAVIAQGFANDGQDVPTDGQVSSLTSTNNFINFCLTVDLPISNGQQLKSGSCNPAPMGAIPSTANMPSSKFSFPQNFGAVKTDTAFTIEMAIQNLETGNFVNADSNYYAAPQQLNAQGQIIGHSHVVIEQLDAIDQTTPTDPNKFAFFKGLNNAAVNGKLTADVSKGLPAGVYKLSSINAAANHQPCLVAIAQHGSLDDAVYFFVTDDGQPPAGAGAGNGADAGGAGAGGSDTGAGGSGAGTGKGGSGNGGNGKGSATDDGAATATGQDGAAASTATATATSKGDAATATATGKGGAATATATGKGGAATATATGKAGGVKGSTGDSTSAADPAATGKDGAAAGTKGGNDNANSESGTSGNQTTQDGSSRGSSGRGSFDGSGSRFGRN